MQEIWKPVTGYLGLYEVSNWGRVKSLRNNKGNPREKILKPSKNRKGYLRVKLYKNGKMKQYFVHRLVAEAFLENPMPLFLTDVNHLDEDKTNNKVENLEWCTRQYNSNYGTRTERIAAALSKQVEQLTLEGELVRTWASTQEAGRNGFNFRSVSACCRNCFNRQGNNVYKGYIWKYKEEEV